jgi:hypothetical protein
MTSKEISHLRLINQKIANTDFKSAGEIVSWMGAIQAQDFSMAKWAAGLRIQESTAEDIEASFDKGEIIRTHVMRPTWHLVAAGDIYWMLELTAPQIKAAMKSRHKELELTEPLVAKCFRIIEKALIKEHNMTREALVMEFDKAGFTGNNNRYAHILLKAEIEGLICSGPLKNNKPSYTLLSERVPVRKVLSKEESLAELAIRFFRSHGPATLKDFVWWSGLPVTDARKGLDAVKSGLFSEKTGLEEYWFANPSSNRSAKKTSIHLLPAYDEFLIGYRDRSASLPVLHNKATVSDNGIFYPIIVRNGKVIGLWKRVVKKDKIVIEINLFRSLNKSDLSRIRQKAKEFGYFLKKETEVKFMNERNE